MNHGARARAHDATPARGPATPIVHLEYAAPRRGIPSAVSFRRWVAAALAAANHAKPAELSIRIVGTREGHALNLRYRHKDYATDVLSFPMEELPPGVESPLLGDLAICAPVVARAAREFRLSLHDHYAHLTVHGVLHLLGYDHHTDADFACMRPLEARALAHVGIADPYRTRDST